MRQHTFYKQWEKTSSDSNSQPPSKRSTTNHSAGADIVDTSSSANNNNTRVHTTTLVIDKNKNDSGLDKVDVLDETIEKHTSISVSKYL